MEIEAEHLFSFLGVVLAAYFSYLGARAQARSKAQATVQDSTDAKMQSMSDKLVDAMTSGFSKRDLLIGKMDARLQSLERKDAAWLTHVLDWREAHPDRTRWPTPPLEVRADLPD